MNINVNNKTKEFLIVIIAAVLTFFSLVIEGLLLFGKYMSKVIIKCLDKRSKNKILTK